VSFIESIVEHAALAWIEVLGYGVLHGPDIPAGMFGAERNDPNYRDVVLEGRAPASLRDTLLPKFISGELRVRGFENAISGDGHREVDCDSRR
jgi:hypothetical protein